MAVQRAITQTSTQCCAAGMGIAVAGLLVACGSAPADPMSRSTAPLSTAADSARIDLTQPTFSDPTSITNPLFPITDLTQVVQVGFDADGALRHEITLLPEIKTIEWNGQHVDTVVSQFVAYRDLRIVEVARDFFAQADDGSVWYFGEDVDNYEAGVIANHDGAWLAGRDGPAGMIMPADPQVGDVYRPENIPDLVFEEVVVKSIDETVDGPQGPIPGCLVIEEHLMDGVVEDKIFAPGYGEFHAAVESENEVVTVSVGVPTDTSSGGVPSELSVLTAAAHGFIAPIEDWAAASITLATMSTAWQGYRGSAGPLTAEQIDEALLDLDSAVAARDAEASNVAAAELAFAVTDLRVRHEDPALVDRYRMDILALRLSQDVASSESLVSGDVAALQTLWLRVQHTIADSSQVDLALHILAAAAPSDVAAVTFSSEQLRTALAEL